MSERVSEHELKIESFYFKDIREGRKKFEIHLNDRDFKKGDVVYLHEFIPATQKLTGKFIITVIDKVYKDLSGVDPEYVIFTFTDFISV